jgi:hypothetical protein
LDENDHLYVIFTTADPPETTDGCVSLVPPGMSLEVNDPDVTLTIPRGTIPCWDGEVFVDWGDGSEVETVASGTASVSHSFAANGAYAINVSAGEGECADIAFEALISGVVARAAAAPKKTAASTESTPPAG